VGGNESTKEQVTYMNNGKLNIEPFLVDLDEFIKKRGGIGFINAWIDLKAGEPGTVWVEIILPPVYNVETEKVTKL